MNLELRHLRYFVTVAEELHFGRAAARLRVAQPPLSQQIRRLERELGVTLFHRSTRRVQLTDAGKILLDEAKRVLAGAAHAVHVVQRAARGESGTLNVGFAASVMFMELPAIIRRFRERFPDVELKLRELPTVPQLARLRSGELDIGFVRQPDPDPLLHMETVMREPLLIAVSKSHPLASRAKVPLEDLKHEEFVMFPREVATGLHT